MDTCYNNTKLTKYIYIKIIQIIHKYIKILRFLRQKIQKKRNHPPK